MPDWAYRLLGDNSGSLRGDTGSGLGLVTVLVTGVDCDSIDLWRMPAFEFDLYFKPGAAAATLSGEFSEGCSLIESSLLVLMDSKAPAVLVGDPENPSLLKS